MKNLRNNKTKRTIVLVLIAMAVIAVSVAIGMWVVMKQVQESNVKDRTQEQDRYVAQLAETLRLLGEQKASEDEVTEYLATAVQASGSRWAFLCRGEQVLFAKNKSTTASISDTTDTQELLADLYSQETIVSTREYFVGDIQYMVGVVSTVPDYIYNGESVAYEIYIVILFGVLLLLATGSVISLTGAWTKAQMGLDQAKEQIKQKNEELEEIRQERLENQPEEHLLSVKQRTGNRYLQYKFKFYLNARHAIYIDGVLGATHPHTWEITMHVIKTRDEFVKFNMIEEQIEAFIGTYQDKILNEVAPFDQINPTLENCCDFFQEQICDILVKEGWRMLMMEMSETPSRSHVISLIDE